LSAGYDAQVFNEPVKEAEAVEKAINATLDAGYRTYDIMGEGIRK